MASAYRQGRDDGGATRRGYVANLLWPRRLPAPANDNRAPLALKLHGALPFVASAALVAAALWAVMG